MAGLYVHVPFRTAPRPYDDAAREAVSADRRALFRSALRTELSAHAAPLLADTSVRSVYVGGGRPSLLPLTDLRGLRSALWATADETNVEEVTVEVNPADVTPAFLHALRREGVTRLSVAVLSFSDAMLRALKAPHTAAEAVQAVRMVSAAGFDTFSIDLCFGLPALDPDIWETTLRRTLALDVPHLTLHEVSGDGAGEDADNDTLDSTITALAEAGYVLYSFPHFARAGHRSVHQCSRDAHESYVGVGPSSASFWWTRQSADAPAERWINHAGLDAYAAALRDGESPVATREVLDWRELAREHLLLRLPTAGGLDLDRLHDRYGVNLRAEKASVLSRLRNAGLIHDETDRVRLTHRGLLVADAVTRRLLPAPQASQVASDDAR